MTLADVLRSHARSRPDATAWVDAADESVASGDAHDVELSWREAAERVHRCAQALRAIGIERGDRVLWLGQGSSRFFELLLACCEIGARFCPANWRQSADEMTFVIEDLSPSLVVWQEQEVGEVAAAARARVEMSVRWIQHDAEGPDSYEALVASGAPSDPDADSSPDDPVLLLYTAAFDGRPAAAMLSSRALLAQATLMAPWQGIDDGSTYLNAGPLFHMGTLFGTLSTFVTGGTNVFVRRSDGPTLCRAIERYGCTGGFVVGPMVAAVADANADGRYDLSTFRGHRGHPGFDRWVERDDSRWGRRPGGYGQTEVTGMATFTLLGADGVGGHGRPSPLVELGVVDPNGRQLPAGEVGEIVVRGVIVMAGYWNRPERNAERSRGGWHHTGDLGRLEIDGTFSFVGVMGRMIKSGAENIYPAEVEQCLAAHPDVAECAVIGVPDHVWVQSVKAVIVARSGARIVTDELVEWCRIRIAGYKRPRFFDLTDALPRTGTGAVDHDALDRQFGGGNYPGGDTPSV